MEVKGDLDVCRSINAARRVNQGQNGETLTATKQLVTHSHYLQRIAATTAQDVVLPDATTLPNGWETKVHNFGTSPITIKTFDPTTPVTLQTIAPGETYDFTLISNGTDEGTWLTDYNTATSMIASDRYIETFNNTTDWGAAVGGKYTYTITQADHGRGVSPIVQVFELSGSDFVKVLPDTLKVLANGNVQITVTEDPDCRFNGKAVLI